MANETEVIIAQCSDHLMTLTSWDDDKDVFLAIWESGSYSRNRFWWAWKCLRSSARPVSELVLSPEDIEQIQSKLTEHLNKIKENNG